MNDGRAFIETGYVVRIFQAEVTGGYCRLRVIDIRNHAKLCHAISDVTKLRDGFRNDHIYNRIAIVYCDGYMLSW